MTSSSKGVTPLATLHPSNENTLPDDKLPGAVDYMMGVNAAFFTNRAWTKNLQQKMQSVGQHSLNVAKIAYMVAVLEGADANKCAAMANIHDDEEILGTEIHQYQKDIVTADANKAFNRLIQGSPAAAQLLALYTEYKDRTTLESQCVKDADILHALLEMATTARFYLKLPGKIDGMRGALNTKTGKRLFEEILATRKKTLRTRWFHKHPSTFTAGNYGKKHS